MRKLGDGAHGSELHRLIDGRGGDVERAAEDVGKAEDVVDLIGIIRAPGADQRVWTRLDGGSGSISGVGLASAMMSGRGPIFFAISGVRTPPAESPRNTSAPPMTSASRRALVSRA